jgi:hypothetical protein
MITVYGALLLSLAAGPARAGRPAVPAPKTATEVGTSVAIPAADSLARSAERDSLVRMVEENRRQYNHPADSGDRTPFFIPAHRLFNADISGPSEAMAAVPLCIPVRFGLSNRLNRYLPYGNTAPVLRIFPDGDLLFTSFDQTKGTDDIFISEISSIALLPADECLYTPAAAAAAVPEGLFYWENGVFRENVLAVRFSRPFSERLNVNIFSNYRHFDGTVFNHNGNDVYNLYRSITPDTSAIVNNGYNPLTNEYTGGALLQWTGVRGNEVRIGARYTDCVNEIALNRPATGVGNLQWGRLNQYRTEFDLGSSGNRLGPAGLDVQARFESDALVRYTPETAGTMRNDGSNNELSCAVRASVPLPDSLKASLLYRVQRTGRKPFDRGESTALGQSPEFSVTMHRTFGGLQTSGSAAAGYELYRLEHTLGTAPSWSAGVEAAYGAQEARAYATQSALPYDIPYDSAMGLSAPLLDRYRIVGGEVSLRRGAAAMVLGCQSLSGIEPVTVERAWPEAAVPYAQPRIVFIAAPALGPWRGFTLSSRALISGSKPVLKNQAVLSFTTNPVGTREHFDFRLGFDYWSARDVIVFANINDWNRPIYNLNFKLTAHIISFRFFGTIDNLLDRKCAYVPGYRSPGVTFRWGFCWFLPR